jgi:cytochrome c
MKTLLIALGLYVSLISYASAIATAAPIHEAAKKGDLAAVAAALDAGVDANASDGLATPLYYAVTKRHFEIAKLLLSRGADVNVVSNWGPPVINAAWNGDFEILKLLLSYGANPNGEFKTETALHLAAQRGHLNCVELLVKAGADVNALTRFREPPIHFAKKNGHEPVVQYLFAHGYIVPAAPNISPKLRAANIEKGRTIFVRECSRCHDAGPEQRIFRGPPLWNIVGRPKALIKDYKYSPAMQAQNGNWSYVELNIFLYDPSRVLPGTDMGSNGVQDDIDRADLIAFLRTRGESPAPLPE